MNENLNIDGAITSIADVNGNDPLGGKDTYTILPNIQNNVLVTENDGAVINLPTNLQIEAITFSATGVQLTVDGNTITINTASNEEADLLCFVFGGTPLDPNAGTMLTFEETAAAFGAASPDTLALGENSSGTPGFISDDGTVLPGEIPDLADIEFSLQLSDTDIDEGEEIVATVVASEPVGEAVTFDYTIEDPNGIITNPTGTVTLLPGQTQRTFTIDTNVNGNIGDVDFTVTLTSPDVEDPVFNSFTVDTDAFAGGGVQQFTIDVDNLVGGPGDDFFSGTVSNLSSRDTFQPGDFADGDDGIDTVEIELDNTDFNGNGAVLNSIERIIVEVTDDNVATRVFEAENVFNIANPLIFLGVENLSDRDVPGGAQQQSGRIQVDDIDPLENGDGNVADFFLGVRDSGSVVTNASDPGPTSPASLIAKTFEISEDLEDIGRKLDVPLKSVATNTATASLFFVGAPSASAQFNFAEASLEGTDDTVGLELDNVENVFVDINVGNDGQAIENFVINSIATDAGPTFPGNSLNEVFSADGNADDLTVTGDTPFTAALGSNFVIFNAAEAAAQTISFGQPSAVFGAGARTGMDFVGGSEADDFFDIAFMNAGVFGDAPTNPFVAGFVDGVEAAADIVTRGGNDVVLLATGGAEFSLGDGNDFLDAPGTFAGLLGNLVGTTGIGNDTIHAGDGNHSVDLGEGSDVFSSGNGDTNVEAGEGDNLVQVGDGDHDIRAGAGMDVVITGDTASGNGTFINTQGGDDMINVGDGVFNILAGDGNDQVIGGDGDFTIDTGPDLLAGNDFVSVGEGSQNIVTGGGLDTIEIGDTGEGSEGSVINSGDADDEVIVNEGDVNVDLGGGDDVLKVRNIDALGSDDVFVGGLGTDTLSLGENGEIVRNSVGESEFLGVTQFEVLDIVSDGAEVDLVDSLIETSDTETFLVNVEEDFITVDTTLLSAANIRTLSIVDNGDIQEDHAPEEFAPNATTVVIDDSWSGATLVSLGGDLGVDDILSVEDSSDLTSDDLERIFGVDIIRLSGFTDFTFELDDSFFDRNVRFTANGGTDAPIPLRIVVDDDIPANSTLEFDLRGVANETLGPDTAGAILGEQVLLIENNVNLDDNEILFRFDTINGGAPIAANNPLLPAWIVVQTSLELTINNDILIGNDDGITGNDDTVIASERADFNDGDIVDAQGQNFFSLRNGGDTLLIEFTTDGSLDDHGVVTPGLAGGLLPPGTNGFLSQFFGFDSGALFGSNAGADLTGFERIIFEGAGARFVDDITGIPAFLGATGTAYSEVFGNFSDTGEVIFETGDDTVIDGDPARTELQGNDYIQSYLGNSFITGFGSDVVELIEGIFVPPIVADPNLSGPFWTIDTGNGQDGSADTIILNNATVELPAYDLLMGVGSPTAREGDLVRLRSWDRVSPTGTANAPAGTIVIPAGSFAFSNGLETVTYAAAMVQAGFATSITINDADLFAFEDAAGGLGLPALAVFEPEVIAGKAGSDNQGNLFFNATGAILGQVDVTGTDMADSISGTELADTIDGQGGDDTLNGNGGDDMIMAASGDNLVTGGDGNDTIMTGDGMDTIVAGAGDDSVESGGGDDSIDGGEGDNFVDAGAGDDHILTGTGNDTVMGMGNEDIIVDRAGTGVITDDTDKFAPIFDPDLTQVLDGGADNDIIALGGTPDESIGSTGQIFGGGGNDAIFTGLTLDAVDSIADLAVAQTVLLDVLGGGALNNGTPGDIDDFQPLFSILGNPADFTQGNRPGEDFVDAGTGDDYVITGRDNDTVLAGEGADTVTGGGGADHIDLGDDDDEDVIQYFRETDGGIGTFDTIRNFDPGEDIIVFSINDEEDPYGAGNLLGEFNDSDPGTLLSFFVSFDDTDNINFPIDDFDVLNVTADNSLADADLKDADLTNVLTVLNSFNVTGNSLGEDAVIFVQGQSDTLLLLYRETVAATTQTFERTELITLAHFEDALVTGDDLFPANNPALIDTVELSIEM